MDELFSSTPDCDGDHLEVQGLFDESASLLVSAYRSGEKSWSSAYVTRDEIAALRDTLTAWLDGTRLPSYVARPTPVSLDDVRTIVAEMLAEERAPVVQPLWTAQQAQDASEGICTIPHCHKFPGVVLHFEHDPEPGDVGHPRPATACTCHDSDGNSVLTADPVDAALADPAVSWSDRLFGKSVPVKVPPQLVGCECGHSWLNHDQTGCTCMRTVAPLEVCACKRTPPVAT